MTTRQSWGTPDLPCAVPVGLKWDILGRSQECSQIHNSLDQPIWSFCSMGSVHWLAMVGYVLPAAQPTRCSMRTAMGWLLRKPMLPSLNSALRRSQMWRGCTMSCTCCPAASAA